MIHLPTGRVYIGQRKLPKGITPADDNYFGSGKIWTRIYKKYPGECVKIILEFADTKEDINKLEIKYIRHYKAVWGYKCVNITAGGEGVHGLQHTEEAKRKISKAKKGCIPWNKNIPQTEEHKIKNSISHKGQIPWHAGRTGVYSDEALEKMRIAHLGKKTTLTKEQIAKRQQKAVETRKKNNKPSPLKGKSRTEEERAKISLGIKKAWEARKNKNI